MPKITTITKRRDFLYVARGNKAFSANLIVQARQRKEGGEDVRIGFVASRKVGHAVARNRAKRRMRALVRDIIPNHVLKGWDYVLIAHPSILTQEYEILKKGLEKSFKKISHEVFMVQKG